VALREVDLHSWRLALKNNGLAKNQDCRWLQLQDINMFVSNQQGTKVGTPIEIVLLCCPLRGVAPVNE
jgi:hypothetical protein